MTTVETPGRRERKKAAVRLAIANAAWELFASRGFDAVSVREVADLADVSTTTLFRYFPSKEALVFDRGDDIEEALVTAVRGTSSRPAVLAALRDYALREWVVAIEDPIMRDFEELVEQTPSLIQYRDQMWSRHADSLANAIARELDEKPASISTAAFARFVLDLPTLLRRREDASDAAHEVFELLWRGWGASAK